MIKDLNKTASKQEPRKCVLCVTAWSESRTFGYAEIETPEGPASAYIPARLMSILSGQVEVDAYYVAHVVDNPREAARENVPYMVVSIDVTSIPSKRDVAAVYLVDGSSL